MKPHLLLTSLFLFSCTLLPSSLSEKCHASDKRALLKIKKDFGNPNVFASWYAKTDCCDWSCVSCNENTHRITSLSVFVDGSLSGQIPSSIGFLPLLETLTLLRQPELTGPIQPAIAKLKNLNFLKISESNVSGSIPEFLSVLKNLTFLDLSVNKLSGSIPSSLSKLPNLQELYLERNKLTGSIPETFGEFKTKDFALTLNNNQLSGKIPVSLGKVNFESFDFSGNTLQGDASMLIRDKTNTTLWLANLSRNLLKFNLSNVRLPKSLKHLDLNHNKITGGIPQSWTSASLDSLNVSYNSLRGQIPVGGQLQTFDYSSYFHNKCLCGSPLPSC
ncbi:hypothetical protein ACFE04_000811 [Oxalis oulophora]